MAFAANQLEIVSMTLRVTLAGGLRTGGGDRPAPGLRCRGRRGFTLMEAMLAITIVGTGILASLELFQTCTAQSRAAHQATTARMLAENIRETMAGLAFNDPTTGGSIWGPEPGEITTTFDDLDDFDGPLNDQDLGTTFNPPIDGTREQIQELARYAQQVTVMPVNPNDPATNTDEAKPTLPKTGYTGAVRVRVRVKYQATSNAPWSEVYTTSWVSTDR
ncbi:MAG TPA: prepilin-type N-terminal cleavage/methylation domain-containing protein [Tepidisphaeraceae bacterium]|nr:prepilin-type N-terminal cleavage/methylation domain-containing protein [Tepidisphaeraceae bacterium]